MTLFFLLVQGYVVWVRERHLTENTVSIKISDLQTKIIERKKRLNKNLVDSILPTEYQTTDKKKGAQCRVDDFSDVTVLFCSIDSFGDISKNFDALDIVEFLNIVYSAFDELAVENKHTYKVETVGEVYMMSAGCPRRTVKHAEYAASMALDMLNSIPKLRDCLKLSLLKSTSVANYDVKKQIIESFNIRVGLNSGALNAGVIGQACMRFKLFGDTVNTASRMASDKGSTTPLAGGFCQVSDSTFRHLVKAKFLFKKRTPMAYFKGKGNIQTYFLKGRNSDRETLVKGVDYEGDIVKQADEVRNDLTDKCKAVLKNLKQREETWEQQRIAAAGSSLASLGGGGASQGVSFFGKAVNRDSFIQDENDQAENAYLSNASERVEGGIMSMSSSQNTKLRRNNRRFRCTTPFDMKKSKEELEKDLLSRPPSQLSLSQTLMLLFGYDLPLIKPNAKDAFGESFYRLHLHIKEAYTIKMTISLFIFFSVMMLIVSINLKSRSSQKEQGLGEMFKNWYYVCIVLLTGVFAFTYSKTFFVYQQLSLSLVFCVFVCAQILDNYQMKPGYSLPLIAVMLMYMLDSMYFLNRVMMSLLFAISYFVFLCLFNVNFMAPSSDTVHSRYEGQDFLAGNSSDYPSALHLSVPLIGQIYCKMREAGADPKMWEELKKPEAWPWNQYAIYATAPEWGGTTTGGGVWGVDGIESVVSMHYWLSTSKAQKITSYFAIEQFAVLIVIVVFLSYPSFMTNYFSRVSFNSKERALEQQYDGKEANEGLSDQLRTLLPEAIVRDYQAGTLKKGKQLDDVTILWVDMVGFTKFSASMEVSELVAFLDAMYSSFDVELKKYNLYKVEIIGDALFAVAGAPEAMHDRYHATRALCAAHGLLGCIRTLNKERNTSAEIRIGVNSGPVVEGVVGNTNLRYHLFGDTTAVAEETESTGAAGMIHVSQSVVDSIKECGDTNAMSGFTFEERHLDGGHRTYFATVDLSNTMKFVEGLIKS